MKLRLKLLLSAALAMTIAASAVRTADAQAYPTRPITVVVPFAGGSASDVLMRIVLNRMSATIGQPLVVDNRPGAGGNIGTGAVARAAPDGYTLVMSSVGPLAANRTLYRELGYDPEKDLEPISLFAIIPNVVVINSKLPPKTLREFIDYAKARPKQFNYGSVGIGSSQHLAGIYFEQIAGVELTHVPYRNIAQFTPDFIAGQVPVGFNFLPNVLSMVKSGDARPLAVSSPRRMPALPDVPTAAEAGLPEYETFGWLALLAPRGTPKPIIDKIHQEMKAAVADASVSERFSEQGAEAVAPGPEELRKFIVSETQKWRETLTKAGVQPIQ